jgi:hypothetical protein
MPIIFRLPDGTTASFPDGTDPAVANARLNADYPELYGIEGKEELRRNELVGGGERKPDEYTVFDRLRKSFNDAESASAMARGGLEDYLGNPNAGTGLSRIAENRLQAKDAQNIAPAPLPLDDVNSFGDAAKFLGQNVIQMAPQLGAAAAGTAAAAATLPVTGPAALAAGLGAGAAINAPSYVGNNIDDQIQQLMAKGLTEGDALRAIQFGPAAVTGILQAGIEALPLGTIAGKPLVSIGKPLIGGIGAKIASTGIGNAVSSTIAGRSAKRAAESFADEALQEGVSQVGTIGQSAYATGEGIGDAVMRRRGEIADAAITGGFVGGGLGAIGGVVAPDRPASNKSATPPRGGSAEFPADSFTPGQRGRFVYDGAEYDGQFVGMSQYGKPIFRTMIGDQVQNLQVQRPEDIIGLTEPQPEMLRLPAPDTTLYAGSQGVGTSSAMEMLRKQVSPLLPEERQPQAGSAYDMLQRQVAQTQQLEADRRVAEEDALRARVEQQNQERLDLKRQQDTEYLANEKLATKVAGAKIDNAISTPRLGYDNTLAVTPEGIAAPRSTLIQQEANTKQSKRDNARMAAQKRIDDGYDPDVEAPAKIVGRAPLPDLDKPALIEGYRERLNNLKADTTEVSQKKPLIKWMKDNGKVKTGSQLAGELKYLGIDPKSQPGLFSKNGIAGDLDNIPASEFNSRFGVAAQEDGNGYVDRNWLLDQIRDEHHGSQIGKQSPNYDESFIQELDEAGLDYRTATPEQVYEKLGNGANKKTAAAPEPEEQLSDAAEPVLPPRDTSADDIPFDIPAQASSTQRFKKNAINKVAQEKQIATSKTIEGNGYYDPLTESKFFPDDDTVDPRSFDVAPKVKASPNWKKEKIEVTAESGEKQQIPAEIMVKKIKEQISTLQKLKACMS